MTILGEAHFVRNFNFEGSDQESKRFYQEHILLIALLLQTFQSLALFQSIKSAFLLLWIVQSWMPHRRHVKVNQTH